MRKIQFIVFLFLAGFPLLAARPGKATSQTLLFPQYQTQYGTFQNFLEWWDDRPLFLDRTHRYPGNEFSYTTDPSNLFNMEQAKSYDFAGFTPLARPSGIHKFLQSAEKHDLSDFFIMPGIYPGRSDLDKGLEDAITLMGESTKVFRINGKMLVNTYEATLLPAPETAVSLDKARQKHGDVFSYIACMKIPCQRYQHHYWSTNRQPRPKETSAFLNELETYLKIADGILVFALGRRFDYEGQYGSRYDHTFFEHIKPLILDTLAKPEFHGKILGATTLLGYTNPKSGMINTSEDGTRSLRAGFEDIMTLEPDFILNFEWNEWNENTGVMPTVRKNDTFARIHRYYARRLRGLPLEPLSGDDIQVPNLAFSYRNSLKLGEILHFELLNIPDGTGRPCEAVLKLRNPQGTVLREFPVWKLPGDKLESVEVSLPTEELLGQWNILLELLIVDGQQQRLYNAFAPIQIHATTNNSYQYLHYPLRRCAVVWENGLKAERLDSGHWRLEGRLESDEILRSVEILEGDCTRRCIEDKPDVDFATEAVLCMHLGAVPGPRLTGPIRVLNASSVRARSAYIDGNNENFQFSITPDGIVYQDQGIGNGVRRLYFIIPKADLDKAVLSVELNVGKFTLPLRDVAEHGDIGKALEGRIHFRFSLLDRQIDIPFNRTSKTAEFDFRLRPLSPIPVWHLRAITESGRIYSRLLAVAQPEGSSAKESLSVYSDIKRQRIVLDVERNRIPRLEYDMSGKNGQILKNGFDCRFDGEMGGAFYYCNPMRTAKAQGSATYVAPTVPEGGGELIFQAEGQFVVLPIDSMPRVAFLLACDFQCENEENAVLFRQFSGSLGPFALTLTEGVLVASYYGGDLKRNIFRTGLTPVKGQWNSLRVEYDLEKLSVTLNGQSESFPLAITGRIFSPLVIGGHIYQDMWFAKSKIPYHFFRGRIRNLVIDHLK